MIVIFITIKMSKQKPTIRIRILLIKRKIIVRKYAYRFYHQTISSILPSVAQKHYRTKVLRKYFRLMKQFMYQEKYIWRLILRANIHYNYTLKERYFQRWNAFKNESKEIKCKLKKSDKHFKLKLKRKSFTNLAYFPLYKKLYKIYNYLLRKYFVFLFLNYSILYLNLNMVNYTKNYLILFYMKRKENIRHINNSFTSIKRYTRNRRIKKGNHNKAINFFKRKYCHLILKYYFAIWKKNTEEAITARLQLNEVENFYERKIMKRVMNKLLWYKEIRQSKRYKQHVVDEFYKTKLKKNVLRRFKMYAAHHLIKIEKRQRAETFSSSKIKAKYFKLLLCYYQKQQRLKFFRQTLIFRIKHRYFRHFQLYVKHKAIEKENWARAASCYNQKLKKKTLLKLANNAKQSKTKSEQIIKFVAEKSKILQRKYFYNWIAFMQDLNEMRSKFNVVIEHYKKKTTIKHWQAWKEYIKDNKIKINQIEKIIMRWSLRHWKQLIMEEKLYRIKMIEAQKIFKNASLKTGFKIFIRAGLSHQIARENRMIDNFEQKLKLVAKYFCIWKNKVFQNNFCGFDDGQIVNYFNSNDAYIEKFQWNSLCFEEPKIPNYLKTIKNNIFD